MLRFAILTAGNIAHHMARTVAAVSGVVEPYAIAARDKQRAADLAAECGFAKSYGSYEELMADPLVDVVYIGSTHNLHAQHVRMALNAGKHVPASYTHLDVYKRQRPARPPALRCE